MAHGHAVAIGMVIIAKAAAAAGICDSAVPQMIETALVNNHLPTRCDYSLARLVDVIQTDKKRRGDIISLVVPERIGHCRLHKINVAELASFIEPGLNREVNMDIKVYPGKLNGQIGAIPSKSAAHRAILAAALADKPTILLVSRPSISQDIAATINCVKALGGEILANNGEITVKPITKVQNRTVLDCGESGTTLRFILPIAAALSDNFSVTGRGRLADRPLEDLCMALESHGCICSSHSIPLGVSGHLHAGEFVLPGKISSQYVSGLLLAAAVLDTKSQITLSTPLESAGYVELTRDVMHSFGIETGKESNSYSVETLGYHSPGTYPIEGDWSNAAFWLVASKNGQQYKDHWLE